MPQYDAFFDILIVLIATVVLETIMLYITQRINKRTYHNNKDYVRSDSGRYLIYYALWSSDSYGHDSQLLSAVPSC